MVSSFYRARTDVYLTLARWIKDVRLNDVPVLMHEPGYFAYWSGSPMIDAAGLITKGIYFHGPEERRTKPDDIVRVHRPGLIVTPPLYWIGLTLDDYLPLYYPVPARTPLRAPIDLRRALPGARGALAGARCLPSRSSRAAAPSAALELRARRRLRLGDRRLDHRLRRPAAAGPVRAPAGHRGLPEHRRSAQPVGDRCRARRS